MTPPIRTRPDGTKYPIREGGGNSNSAVIAVGVALTVWVTSGGAGLSVGGSAESAAMSAAESVVVQNIKTNLPKARQDVQRGKPDRAFQRLKLHKGPEEIHEAVECAVFSYGQVQEFFARKPCKELQRAQFSVSYNGGAMAVLVSRVRMHSARDARGFRNLIDEHGTGDIQPLLPDVRFTGRYYDSDRERSTVIVAETEAIAGDVPEPILEATAEAVTLLARSATAPA